MATVTTTPPVVNVPNLLTGSRLVLGLVLFGLIHHQLWVACIIVFALAAATDWLDGYLARRQNLTSTLGRNLDPLVDKVVICGAFTFLIPIAEAGVTPWMVTVVVGRELIITSLRSFMENAGAQFGADWLGKIKMVLQCAALLAVFIDRYLAAAQAATTVTLARDVLIYAMIVATALSGLQYLGRAYTLVQR
ncbi:MAG: CDP-diacylglycerol--glycerol-3-phosphate 3-phosphatidyltransferase [Gemmataceae bacterium]|nr:CDP-diacylglycerol--glycerol-3-phosphate 3-phosphatidyltransferase [Gemmataceae bacterium]